MVTIDRPVRLNLNVSLHHDRISLFNIVLLKKFISFLMVLVADK